MEPKVTVLLPVYNCERFILKAVESILRQTFSNIECIIIDDCSTDNTLSIIRGIHDNRIKLITKPRNTGYVESLNMGATVATGKYIARMDADDISLPERITKQVHFLEEHPQVSVVASKIKLINENDIITGDWKNDRLTNTNTDIVRYLPKGNCVCHPSIMIRKELLDQYGYDIHQYGSEDWDLWLRLISDGYTIEKLPDVLLHYRITTSSVSATIDKRIGVLKKANKVRMRYLTKRIKAFAFNHVDMQVCYYMLYTQLRIVKNFVLSFFRKA